MTTRILVQNEENQKDEEKINDYHVIQLSDPLYAVQSIFEDPIIQPFLQPAFHLMNNHPVSLNKLITIMNNYLLLNQQSFVIHLPQFSVRLLLLKPALFRKCYGTNQGHQYDSSRADFPTNVQKLKLLAYRLISHGVPIAFNNYFSH